MIVFLRFKDLRTQKLLVKHLWNWPQVSISSTFYARILRQYFGTKNYKAETYLEKAAQSTFVQ